MITPDCKLKVHRIYCPIALNCEQSITLPEHASRHIQVLRLQPMQTVRLFNGNGGEFIAQIERIQRKSVQVIVRQYCEIEHEISRNIHLIVAIPAYSQRMDYLIEKATELGVASIQPLVSNQSAIKLSSEQAHKKLSRWRYVAINACEQCGRNLIPEIHVLCSFSQWLSKFKQESLKNIACLLSLESSAPIFSQSSIFYEDNDMFLLSGPEGGFTTQEENLAQAAGFLPYSLGKRILRSETAPLVALSWIMLTM